MEADQSALVKEFEFWNILKRRGPSVFQGTEELWTTAKETLPDYFNQGLRDRPCVGYTVANSGFNSSP